MKLSEGLKEENVVIGNVYNKYSSSNPFVKKIMENFLNSMDRLVEDLSPKSIHEIGCGEGIITLRSCTQGRNIRGSDFSEKVIKIAQENAISVGISPDIFYVKNIYDLTSQQDGADLIICSEVLEHLEEPALALQVIQELACDHVIFTVPREPLWRILNCIRGQYLNRLGNTLGHIQHWSLSSFVDLVRPFFCVEKVLTPLPWTMLLCRNSRFRKC